MRASCTTKARPASGPVHTCSWQHYAMVEAFRTAREAWEQQLDGEKWPTERRQFRAAHPPPRLRDFMGCDAHLDYCATHHDREDDDDTRPAEDAHPGRRLAS